MPRYQHRGGGVYGAVVRGDAIVPNRLIVVTQTGGRQDSWRLRDFTASLWLSSEDCNINLSDIEKLVTYWDATMPPLNVETDKLKWKGYITGRSIEVLGQAFDATTRPILAGPWKSL